MKSWLYLPFVISLTMLALFISALFLFANGEDKEETNDLVLTMGIVLNKAPSMVMCKATNTTDRTIVVDDFYHNDNRITIVRPDGKKDIGYGTSEKRPNEIPPNGEKIWYYTLQTPLFLYDPGQYTVYWTIGNFKSNELIVYVEKKEK